MIETAVLVFGLGGLVDFWLRRAEPFRDHFPFAEAAAGGICLAILVSFGGVIFAHLLPASFKYFVGGLYTIASVSSLALAIKLVPRARKIVLSKAALFVFFILIVVSIIRFSFLYNLQFPPYLDSPVHFQIIQDLRNPASAPLAQFTVGKLFALHYYHFGFHSLVAVISAFGNTQGALQTMLVIGQLMVVILPFSLAFFAREFTGSTWVGVFTALFAGIGWRMPAYAINRGKYPAIAAIAIFPLALGWLAILLSKDRGKGVAWFLAAVGCVTSLLLHSRMLLLFLAVLIAFVVFKLLSNRLNGRSRLLIILIEIVLMAILVHGSPDLAKAISIYIHGTDLIVTCIAVFFSILAVQHDSKHSLAIFTFSLVIFIFCLTPLPGSLKDYLGSYTWLDRPLVEMILFAPLAILAGMGIWTLRGLKRRLPGGQKTYWGHLGSTLFIIALILPVYFHAQDGDYRPDACCSLVNGDDIIAITWINAHLPAGSQVLISDHEVDGQTVGTDAGIWITPMTGIRTVQYIVTTDFSDRTIYRRLCSEQIGYIFLGSRDRSFNAATLTEGNGWYVRLLDLPLASLYRINCPIQ